MHKKLSQCCPEMLVSHVHRTLQSSSVALLLLAQANAQQFTNFADPNWNIAGNWSALPVAGPTTALTSASGVATTTQNLGNPFVLNSMTNWRTINGNAISFAGTNARFRGVNNAQVNVPLILTVDTSFSGGSFGGENVFINSGVSGAGKFRVVENGNINLASVATNTGGVLVEGADLLVTAVNGLPPTGEIALVSSPFGTDLTTYQAQTIDQLRMDGGTFLALAPLTIQGIVTLNSGSFFTTSVDPIVANGAITKATSGQASIAGIQMAVGLWNQMGKLEISGTSSGDILNEADLIVRGNLTTDMYSTGKVTVNDSILTTQMTNQGEMLLLGTATVNGSITNLTSIKVIDVIAPFTTIPLGTRKINANVSNVGSLLVEKNVELNGLNTYSGGSTCNQATVFGDTDGIQGNWVLNNGVMRFDQATNGVMAGNISGTGAIFIDSSDPTGVGSRVTLSGDNSGFSGTINADGGNLGFGSSTAAGTQSITAGLTQPSRLSAVGDSWEISIPLITGGSLLEISGTEKLSFSDLTPKNFTTGTLRHTSTNGTTLGGAFVGQGSSLIDVQSGTLTLGRNQASGFRTDGTVMVAAGARLDLVSSNFVKLGVTFLNGGTIFTNNGLVVGSGGTLIGSGTISSRVALDPGAVIIAEGTMQLGDATSFAGFFSQGEMQVHDAAVTILDRNHAVMGSLTSIYDGGTILAPLGLFVDFGRAIEGNGTVTSNNTLATAMIINGNAAGESAFKRLALNGYVKGLGTFTDVDFLGTFSPGLSPATVAVNFSNMGNGSTLELELGGTAAGSEHDQLSILGDFALAGTLKISLINGFTPSAGQFFQLFDGSTSGNFTTLMLPSLPVGLFWHTAQLYSDGLLSVGLTPDNYAGFESYYALTTPTTGDEDHDGYSNLLEYALGSNPVQSNSPGVSAMSFLINDSSERFSFSMPKPCGADLELTIQSSTNLATWIDLAEKEGPGAWTGSVLPLLSPMGAGRESVELQQFAPFPDKRFYRLKVLLNP